MDKLYYLNLRYYTYDSEGRLRCQSDDTYTRYYLYGAAAIIGFACAGIIYYLGEGADSLYEELKRLLFER